MSEPTILAAVTTGLLDAAVECGADREKILRAAGVPAEVLADPDGRTSLEVHFRVVEALAAHGPSGLEIGDRVGGNGFGVVSYAMAHEATLGAALQWLHRYRHVVFEEVLARPDLREENGRPAFVLVHFVPPRLSKLREPAEAYAAATLSGFRHVTGERIRPLRVAFQHSAPESTARHEAYFGCPVEFGAPALEMAFDPAILELKLSRANPHLFGYLARRAEELRQSLPAEASVADRTRRAIGEKLAHGEPTLAEIAKTLALSSRTLHRRLKEAGTGFAELLDEARRERALMLLEDRRLTIAEISFLLGYAEPTAFFRAFRRWTGKAPQQFREEQRRSA